MEADRDALARYLDGDERAFEELVIRYEARVRNIAYGVLRDHALAEDVAQETFLTAYRKAGSFRAEGSVRSWLFRIAVRRALDELKKRNRKGEVALIEERQSANEPHQQLDTEWDLSRAIESLAPEHRAAIVLKEVEGLSYQEIAESLDWPIGTVSIRIHRARLELKAKLQENANVMS